MNLSACFAQPITRAHAREISLWRYEPPYDVYNLRSDEDTLLEFLSDDYYVVLEDKAIIGYFCLGEAGRVPGGHALVLYDDDSLLDIGLGMRPDLVGHGNGLDFLNFCMSFAFDLYKPQGFRLSVAAFNTRAIGVYRKAGFVKTIQFSVGHPNSSKEFWLMVRRIDTQ